MKVELKFNVEVNEDERLFRVVASITALDIQLPEVKHGISSMNLMILAQIKAELIEGLMAEINNLRDRGYREVVVDEEVE